MEKSGMRSFPRQLALSSVLSLWLLDVVSCTTTAYVSSTIRPCTQYRSRGTALKPFFKLRNRRAAAAGLAVQGGGDDGVPNQPILIGAKDDTTQQLTFLAAFAALAVGTNACIYLWNGPGRAVLGTEQFDAIQATTFPIAFGSIFAVVGVLHFVFVENFARIVPPRGTWGGLWQAPSPFQDKLGITYAEYHSYWTGVAEFVGGVWLLAGGLGFTSTQVPAMLLFLLTVGVTPANLYMFTHDANPGGAIPRLAYPSGHIARFVVQCGLLSNFWVMSHV